jgi:hypothetical protein
MHKTLMAGALALAFATPAALAKVGPDEAGKLGKDLTPIGAEKAGNSAGTIPAWTPYTQAGNLKGEYTSDAKIDSEKPLYTITKGNFAQYADTLSEGHKYLLKTNDTYKMNVYPSHRMTAWPEFIYKATAENAVNCELVGVDNPNNCKQGFLYPIPKSGAEVIWNHKVKYRADGARRFNNQMIVQTDGKFQLTKIVEEVKFYYATDKNPVPLTKDSGLFIKYFSLIQDPPRMSGTMILVHERAGSGDEGRQAWLYAPALKRIRRAPTVCCDNPYEGTDGHQFYDQVDMFNGILDRYTWKVVGKKEIIIPANSNKISGPSVKYADMAKPRHLNQDLPRYELHRVWVVEAELRPGTSHTFAKRRFYVDEDGWQIVLVDDYDANGGLYQFQEGHYVSLRNILGSGTIPEVIYHMTSGRYFITALANEDKPNDYTFNADDAYFEAASVQKRASK